MLQGREEILPRFSRNIRRQLIQDLYGPGLRVEIAGLGTNPQDVPFGEMIRVAR
jgi:hypothetical protein